MKDARENGTVHQDVQGPGSCKFSLHRQENGGQEETNEEIRQSNNMTIYCPNALNDQMNALAYSKKKENKKEARTENNSGYTLEELGVTLKESAPQSGLIHSIIKTTDKEMTPEINTERKSPSEKDNNTTDFKSSKCMQPTDDDKWNIMQEHMAKTNQQMSHMLHLQAKLQQDVADTKEKLSYIRDTNQNHLESHTGFTSWHRQPIWSGLDFLPPSCYNLKSPEDHKTLNTTPSSLCCTMSTSTAQEPHLQMAQQSVISLLGEVVSSSMNETASMNGVTDAIDDHIIEDNGREDLSMHSLDLLPDTADVHVNDLDPVPVACTGSSVQLSLYSSETSLSAVVNGSRETFVKRSSVTRPNISLKSDNEHSKQAYGQFQQDLEGKDNRPKPSNETCQSMTQLKEMFIIDRPIQKAVLPQDNLTCEGELSFVLIAESRCRSGEVNITGDHEPRAAGQEPRAAHQELIAAHQELRAAHQELRAAHQELRVAAQELRAAGQERRAAGQERRATCQDIRVAGQEPRIVNQMSSVKQCQVNDDSAKVSVHDTAFGKQDSNTPIKIDNIHSDNDGVLDNDARKQEELATPCDTLGLLLEPNVPRDVCIIGSPCAAVKQQEFATIEDLIRLCDYPDQYNQDVDDDLTADKELPVHDVNSVIEEEISTNSNDSTNLRASDNRVWRYRRKITRSITVDSRGRPAVKSLTRSFSVCIEQKEVLQLLTSDDSGIGSYHFSHWSGHSTNRSHLASLVCNGTPTSEAVEDAICMMRQSLACWSATGGSSGEELVKPYSSETYSSTVVRKLDEKNLEKRQQVGIQFVYLFNFNRCYIVAMDCQTYYERVNVHVPISLYMYMQSYCIIPETN